MIQDTNRLAWLPWIVAGAVASIFVLGWQVQVIRGGEPDAHTLFQADSLFQPANIFLVFGLLLSVASGWLLHAALVSRQNLEHIQAQSDQLAILLKNLPGMVFRCRNEEHWPLEFVSEGCLELSGYSKDEFESGGTKWSDVVHPDDLDALIHTIQTGVANNGVFESEHRIITRDNQEKWVWSRGSLVDSVGSDQVVLEGLVTNITNLKTAVIAQSDAENYFKAIIDTAAEAIFTTDNTGHIESFNDAAQNMFQYTRAEVLGHNATMLGPEPAGSNPGVQMTEHLAGIAPQTLVFSSEVSARRKDGSVFPAHLSVSELRSRDDCNYIGIMRDLSEQRAAEQDASQHRERLRCIDRTNMLGGMTSSIAHELNQPLSAISMYSQAAIQILANGEPKEERLRDALEKLCDQTQRAGSIIERMQRLGKHNMNQKKLFDGNALVQDVLTLAKTEAQRRNIEIELDVSPEARQCYGDPVQIQQVALSLLRNAMEAMDEDGYKNGHHIQLRTRSTDQEFTVFVIDEGPGIPEDTRENLFQPFASTKIGGVGLGLSICMSIISAHFGNLGYSNNSAGGATFYFTLPHAARDV